MISYGIDLALPILYLPRYAINRSVFWRQFADCTNAFVSGMLRSVCYFSYPDTVNSFHDFSLMECPKDFDICAFSEDGCIEAVAAQTITNRRLDVASERELESSKVDTDNIARIFS